MNRKATSSLPAALVAALFSATPLMGQESTTRGFTVALHGSGASLAFEGQERSNAGGGGIRVGYGINRTVTIFAQADGAEFDEASTGDIEGRWTMGHFDLGVRYNFANSLRSYVPFLTAALGARAVSVQNPIVNNVSEEEVSISGGALTIGGGVDVYLSEEWAIDLELLWSGGSFTTIRVNNISRTGLDADAQSTRLNIGVAWWP